MKNLRNLLATTVFAVILTISTGVFAFDGVVNNEDNLMTMPSAITNGEGTVSASEAGTMSYQFVEITDEQYNKVQQLQKKLAVIMYYRAWEADYSAVAGEIRKEENANYIKFEELKEAYNTAYPEDAFGDGLEYTEIKLNETSNALTTAYPEFVEANWVEVTDGKVSIDLSTFSGSKKYILWTKLVGTSSATPVYNAQVYTLTGTKKEETKPENKVEPKTDPENKVEPKTEPKSITPAKKDGSTTSKSIPYTGASNAVLGLIALASTVAGTSYIKYRKIK